MDKATLIAELESISAEAHNGITFLEVGDGDGLLECLDHLQSMIDKLTDEFDDLSNEEINELATEE